MSGPLLAPLQVSNNYENWLKFKRDFTGLLASFDFNAKPGHVKVAKLREMIGDDGRRVIQQLGLEGSNDYNTIIKKLDEWAETQRPRSGGKGKLSAVLTDPDDLLPHVPSGFSIRPSRAAYEENESSRAVIRWTVENVCVLPSNHESPPFYLRGLPWRITFEKEGKFLAVYVQCDGDPDDDSWECSASYTLKLIPQKIGVKPIVERLDHDFYAEDDNWGTDGFVSLNKVKDPQHGFNKNNSIILELSITVSEVMID